MTTFPEVLIASSGLDEGSWRPVVSHIERAGRSIWMYEADKVATGLVELTMALGPGGDLRIDYAGERVSLDRISGAWYRRPNEFSGDLGDRALQITLDTERRLLQYGIWSSVAAAAWLTDPRSLVHAEYNLVQLMTAKESGFAIPQTLVTNTWGPLQELPPEIIYKPSYGTLYDNAGMRLLYTTPLVNDPGSLPVDANPFPGLWQPNLPKAREWRVTLVGDDLFPAAIYTELDAKDDWRRHQLHSASVRFVAEQLDEATEAACRRYAELLDLGFTPYQPNGVNMDFSHGIDIINMERGAKDDTGYAHFQSIQEYHQSNGWTNTDAMDVYGDVDKDYDYIVISDHEGKMS